MIFVAPILDRTCLAYLREIAARAAWVDGRITARTATQKHNEQVAVTTGYGQMAAHIVVGALLERLPFRPVAMTTPMLNRYSAGMQYGPHCDAPVMDGVRTDLAATLFLSEPEEYDGGELVIGETPLKLRAGELLFYKCGEIHCVRKVTRGERLALVLWMQVSNLHQRQFC